MYNFFRTKDGAKIVDLEGMRQWQLVFFSEPESKLLSIEEAENLNKKLTK